jgi:hypothetical protein
MIHKFNMKEISSMNFPQHGEVFYFYGQALIICTKIILWKSPKLTANFEGKSLYFKVMWKILPIHSVA